MSERGVRGGAGGWKEGDVYNNIHAGGREEGGEEWAVGVLDERLMRCWQSRTCGREKRDDGYWNTGPGLLTEYQQTTHSLFTYVYVCVCVYIYVYI